MRSLLLQDYYKYNLQQLNGYQSFQIVYWALRQFILRYAKISTKVTRAYFF